jgi:hypothetical protein
MVVRYLAAFFVAVVKGRPGHFNLSMSKVHRVMLDNSHAVA